MRKVKGYLLAFASAISYGLIPLFIIPVKMAHFSVDTTLAYRFSIATIFAAFLVLLKKESFRINKMEFLILLSLGLDYAISNDLLFWGYDLTTPGIASTLLFLYPVIVASIAVLIFKEKLRIKTVLAIITSLIGVYLLIMGNSVFNINLPGFAVLLVAAFFYALFIVTVNRTKIKASAWKLSFYSLFFAALYYLLKVGIRSESLQLPDFGTLLNFTIFALVTTVISNVALIGATRMIGAVPTSIMGVMEPVVGVLVSVILFGEDMTVKLIVGIILILAGVILNILAGRKRKEKQLM